LYGKGETRLRWLHPWLLSYAILGLILAFGAFPVWAQEDRDFAEPQYWLNNTPDLRLPIRERQVNWFTGITGPRPPEPKKSGWTPRLSFGVESRDKSSGIGGTDTIATLTPGLSYTKYSQRWWLGADLTFDIAKHYDQEQFSYEDPNVIADIQAVYALSENSSLSAFADYSRLRDTGDAIQDGFLPPNTIISRRTVTLVWANELTRRDNLEVLYSNTHEAIDRPLQPDTTSDTVSLLYGRKLSERDLLEGIFYYDRVAFEGLQNDTVRSASARYTRDMGERLSFSFEAGGISTSAAGGRDYPKFGVNVAHTTSNARYELSIDRDIITIAGLASLTRSDLITASGHFRIMNGLQLQALAEHQRLKGLGLTALDTQVTSLELALSYAVNRNVWIWARLRESRQKSGLFNENDTRVYLGVSRTFN